MSTKSGTSTSLVDVMTPKLPGPVTALNDADAAGLAEVQVRGGTRLDGVVIMVTFGTGIGIAIINNGQLVPNCRTRSPRDRRARRGDQGRGVGPGARRT